MPNAFISYRRKPSAALAHLLQNDLQARYGFDIYLDVNRNDGAKVQFPERLLGAIDASDVFICLLADTTLESEWVLREIQRAFEGQKPCIPVFQESYQPTTLDHPAVDYLLSFDGVHVLDERGLYMDESVQKIGTIIRNTLPKRRRTAFYTLPLVLLLVVGLIAAIVLLTNGDDDNRKGVTPSHEAAVQETNDTPDPTATQTPTATNTNSGEQATNTLSIDERAQATANAVSTLNEDYRRATATEQAIRDSHDTATALPLTQAAQETTDAIAAQTRVAELQTTWTPTPTSTPSSTPTFTSFSTATTATLSPIELAKTRVAHNSDWTVYSELDSKGVEMVLVPAGCFMMGSEDGANDESPVYEQCIDEPFWIDKYEVTNEQYGSVGCSTYSSKPDQPRNCVTWFDARTYCESRGAQLPTEREWEYAARGPDNLVYPWGNTYDATLVIGSDDPFYGQNKPAAVGSRPEGVSWVGALDMSGNLLEWTSTVYMDYPYVATDRREDLTGSEVRVLRGGSFLYSTFYPRTAVRFRDYRFNMRLDYGFRCVRSIN